MFRATIVGWPFDSDAGGLLWTSLVSLTVACYVVHASCMDVTWMRSVLQKKYTYSLCCSSFVVSGGHSNTLHCATSKRRSAILEWASVRTYFNMLRFATHKSFGRDIWYSNKVELASNLSMLRFARHVQQTSVTRLWQSSVVPFRRTRISCILRHIIRFMVNV